MAERAHSPSLHSYALHNTPEHPVTQMRAAFAESILDVTRPSNPKHHHHLRKLVAQVSFGLYLLHTNQATCTNTVLEILQSHLDEFERFLSKRSKFLEGALSEISSRGRHISIPMESPAVTKVFERMLESRDFRREVLDRNMVIENAVDGTEQDTQKTLKDVKQGLEAADELAEYLLKLKKHRGPAAGQKFEHVLDELTRNVALWYQALLVLLKKGRRLARAILDIRRLLREVERRAGAASRKAVVSAPVPARGNHGLLFDKPLPITPSSTPIPIALDTSAYAPVVAKRHPQSPADVDRSSKRVSRVPKEVAPTTSIDRKGKGKEKEVRIEDSGTSTPSTMLLHGKPRASTAPGPSRTLDPYGWERQAKRREEISIAKAATADDGKHRASLRKRLSMPILNIGNNKALAQSKDDRDRCRIM